MNNTIDFGAIRAAHDLIDVAARYCELKRQGSEYACLCPFHDDSHPSCTFYQGTDGVWRYQCFACDAGGDVIDFVAGMNNVDTAEAARILAGNSLPANPNPVARPPIPPDETKIWEPIIPVPDDAPEYDPANTYNCKAGAVRCHKPQRIDPYYDGHGQLICYVTRLEFNGQKITPVITYCEGEGGERRWCSKRMDPPYPLMGLDELANRPTASVLLVSGEKCKVAASARLPKSVVVTTMGGDGAVLKNDLSPLANRHVVLWPDADKSGRDSMAEIGRKLNPDTVRHIDTTGLPEKYDVADLLATGISDDDLYDWLKARVKPGNLKYRRKIVDKGVQRPPAPPPEPPPSNVVPIKRELAALGVPPEYSEDSLAEAFSKEYQNSMLYVAAMGTWLEWRDNRWQDDETALALDLSRKICKKAANEAQKRTDLGSKAGKMATAISSRKTFANVAAIAQTDRRHAAIPAQFDADPWIINTPGGVVDLKTGELRAARFDDFARKSTAIAPEGDCPTWERFLQTSTDGDDELIEYLKRLSGYCLTGSVAEHTFFFVYGTGRNGKGTYVNTISWILNSYWRNSNMDTFTEQRFSKHASEIAYFQGSRLVTAQETEEGKRWNESRVKAMTGGDPITANHMYQNPFTFQPSFKLLFNGNHKPALRNIDEAIKNRMHMIPFTVYIKPEDRDKRLDKKLQAEAGGILKWMIEGCLDWQDQGLNPPDRVLATTEEYFSEQDTLGVFFDERCKLDPNLWTPTTMLYNAYVSWAKGSGEFVLSRRRFTDQLPLRNLFSEKRGGSMAVQGVAVSQLPEHNDWRDDYDR